MAQMMPGAKIIDLTVEIDSRPIESATGLVAWATVAITYASGDLEPTLAIRVPVPWSHEDKKREALSRARQLIDHACTASGLNMVAPPAAPGIMEDTVLEGLPQELGISEPTTKAGRKTPKVRS